MIKRLVLSTAAGFLFLPHVSSAADATWSAVATLENGGPQCGSGRSDWRIKITDATVEYLNVAANQSTSVDLKGLKSDGSGKVTSKDSQNREFYIAFEPGSGPRVMRSGNSNNDCVWIFTPKS
jgi:hypothetical protein